MRVSIGEIDGMPRGGVKDRMVLDWSDNADAGERGVEGAHPLFFEISRIGCDAESEEEFVILSVIEGMV